jgi:hypothetical protein
MGRQSESYTGTSSLNYHSPEKAVIAAVVSASKFGVLDVAVVGLSRSTRRKSRSSRRRRCAVSFFNLARTHGQDIHLHVENNMPIFTLLVMSERVVADDGNVIRERVEMTRLRPENFALSARRPCIVVNRQLFNPYGSTLSKLSSDLSFTTCVDSQDQNYSLSILRRLRQMFQAFSMARSQLGWMQLGRERATRLCQCPLLNTRPL